MEVECVLRGVVADDHLDALFTRYTPSLPRLAHGTAHCSTAAKVVSQCGQWRRFAAQALTEHIVVTALWVESGALLSAASFDYAASHDFLVRCSLESFCDDGSKMELAYHEKVYRGDGSESCV